VPPWLPRSLWEQWESILLPGLGASLGAKAILTQGLKSPFNLKEKCDVGPIPKRPQDSKRWPIQDRDERERYFAQIKKLEQEIHDLREKIVTVDRKKAEPGKWGALPKRKTKQRFTIPLRKKKSYSVGWNSYSPFRSYPPTQFQKRKGMSSADW
jgi:hypothetical protein